ncbi:MAG: hypothetical protein A3H28_13370 [Acidobacteria bacterium RIFCSPLOWO2_02_FULL_61_28]|nr:MAG: hypothetical protein A3H28_13370 [Acidobacteria bacterium RIFCSPLOWO2_02_FULL_61_28]
MISLGRALAAVILLAPFAYGAGEGTISGTVKDPAGAAFKGVFVRAYNVKTKMTVSVLSDKQGHYRAPNLPPGDYRVRATAVGYKDDLRGDIKIAASQSLTLNFTLQKGMARWEDLSLYQGVRLLPQARGKELLETQCFECHHFQTRMAAKPRNEAGWRAAMNYMRESEGFRGEFRALTDRPYIFCCPERVAYHNERRAITEQDYNEMISYLAKYFGPDSRTPSPEESPHYKELVRPVSDEATQIVYVDYPMPGPDRYPFSAAPDKNGIAWIPYFGRANQIARLDPATGEVQEFPVPHKGTAAIHTAVPAPDGTVWLGEQAPGKLGKWDPVTRTITEYQDPGLRRPDAIMGSASKHTVRVDASGRIWASGAVSLFDPKTKEFTHFPELPAAYGVVLDAAGNGWFTEFPRRDGMLAKVDGKTGKVTKYHTPTPKSGTRRIQIDRDGMVWIAEYYPGKIARFDPKTETFKEYQLPGPSPTPYAFEIDNQGRLWYSSFDMDTVGCLDPKTGKVIEYPFPYSENTMREFFRDAQGRIWFGTPANNKVGYFIPPTGS